MSFQQNVFVNYPLDDDYLPLLRPLLFSIIYLQLTPRIALERLDSGEPRVQKIISLIKESKYAFMIYRGCKPEQLESILGSTCHSS